MVCGRTVTGWKMYVQQWYCGTAGPSHNTVTLYLPVADECRYPESYLTRMCLRICHVCAKRWFPE